MKWTTISLRRALLVSLYIFFFGLCFVPTSGCNYATKEGQDKQRYSLEQISLSTKASADILGKANKEVDGVEKIISTLNKNFKDIPKPEPFKIPDWFQWLLYGIGALLVPDAVKKTLQGAGKGAGILGKLFNGNKGKK